MKYIIHIIFYNILQVVSNTVSKFIKRSDDLILFGAMNGRYFGDNSKYIYEWCLENSDKKVIWLTNNKEVYEELSRQNKPVAMVKSLKGIFSLYRAKCATFTNSLRDISFQPYLIPKSLKLIALRHGRSVKKVRFARENHKISNVERLQRNQESKLIRYAISTSEFISDIQEQCLLIGREKHIVTGYPRNDDLLQTQTNHKKRNSFKKNLTDKDVDHIILYGPSWRHGRKPTRFFPFKDFDITTLINYLERKKVLLLLRPHVNDLRQYKDLGDLLHGLDSASSYISMATHEIFSDVNAILPFVDTLISDYSALYHDFLIFDKPMIFIPYDYEDFSRNNGFLYDYFHYLPGPVIDSFDVFMEELNHAVEGFDKFEEKRKHLKKLVHDHIDTNSSKRVYELIERL
jgi:CDP-glycerol glycerophosphotransferase (TagB/SpsB family)